MNQEENYMDNIKNEVGPDVMAEIGAMLQQTKGQQLFGVAIELCQVFKDQNGEPFASTVIDGKEIHMSMESKSFKDWLSMVAHDNNISPTKSVVADALAILRAEALFKSDFISDVHNRIGLDPNKNIWIYAGSFNEPHYLKIAPDGTIDSAIKAPIKFAPSKNTRAFPNIKIGNSDYNNLGNIMLLKQHLNVTDDGFILMVIFIIQCYFPDRDYVILQLLGEQGSGKSKTNSTLRKLVDPSDKEKTSPPRKTDDLIVSAINGHLLDFDNLSKLPNFLADDFCRLSTGGTLAKRTLYSDRDETVLKARRPIIINGISQPSIRPDLMQRSVVLNLPPLDKSNRIHPRALENSFKTNYEIIFGCLMNLTAQVYALINTKEWKKKINSMQFERMAEYHELGLAVEQIMDWPEETFNQAFTKNILEGYKSVIDSEPIAITIFKFIDARYVDGITSMEKSATDWQYAFNQFLDNDKALKNILPKSPEAIGHSFNRIKPTLKEFGVRLTKRELHNNNVWNISIQNKNYIKNTSYTYDSIPSDVGSVASNNTESFQPSLEDYPERNSNNIYEPDTEPPAEKEELIKQDHTGMPWEENQN